MAVVVLSDYIQQPIRWRVSFIAWLLDLLCERRSMRVVRLQISLSFQCFNGTGVSFIDVVMIFHVEVALDLQLLSLCRFGIAVAASYWQLCQCRGNNVGEVSS